MIKGAQKQMLVIRTGGSRYFDEAYFILRRELPREGTARGDILKEANRILEESGVERGVRTRHRRSWLYFAGGILCGALLATLLGFLLF